MAPNQDDPLTRFKLIQHNATADDPPGLDAKKKYLAFDTGDRSQERLNIRRVLGEWHSPSYSYLMDVLHDDEGTEIRLTFSFLAVKIKGKNLLPLVDALEDGTCIFIQEFDEREFPRPSQKDPIIDEIEAVLKDV